MFVHKIKMFMGKIHFRYLIAKKVSPNLAIQRPSVTSKRENTKIFHTKWQKNFGNKMYLFHDCLDDKAYLNSEKN